ncbi:MAG: hypothetical protein F6K36_27485 [Symploca sp. SIO3C6]|nr:hypothetical protein [Symploca sp. SIO3C6]NEO99128.1 hypothetical protein [Symploca sp. SIO2E9]NET07836.1 hypothetical protein [Symploca sp. SIO2B6]
MSKYDELLKAAQQGKAERLDSQTPSRLVGKNKDPNYTKGTFYLPKELYMKFKVTVMQSGQEMSALVEELIEDWLKQQEN